MKRNKVTITTDDIEDYIDSDVKRAAGGPGYFYSHNVVCTSWKSGFAFANALVGKDYNEVASFNLTPVFNAKDGLTIDFKRVDKGDVDMDSLKSRYEVTKREYDVICEDFCLTDVPWDDRIKEFRNTLEKIEEDGVKVIDMFDVIMDFSLLHAEVYIFEEYLKFNKGIV